MTITHRIAAGFAPAAARQSPSSGPAPGRHQSLRDFLGDSHVSSLGRLVSPRLPLDEAALLRRV